MTVYFAWLSTASMAEWWLWEVIKKWIKSPGWTMGWKYVSAGVNIILLMTWLYNHFKLTFLVQWNIFLQGGVPNSLKYHLFPKKFWFPILRMLFDKWFWINFETTCCVFVHTTETVYWNQTWKETILQIEISRDGNYSRVADFTCNKIVAWISI